MARFFVLGNAIDDSTPILEMQLGNVWVRPCMSQTDGGFQLTSNFKINRSISHGSEYCLCIGVLRMVQPKSRFRNLKRVDGTAQRVCVWCFFRSVNSKAAYWPNTSSRQKVAAAHRSESRWHNFSYLAML